MYNIRPVINRTCGKTKSGRGFSQEELAKAGITCTQADQLGIPVDFRRRSEHESNIEILKAQLAATTSEA